ncbi:hypothetical protein [Rhizobium tropici]|uniref:hypothetical protein n=1 Tax=Rhizobium tropici TaxID=398 RepID=UPI00165FD880|nr:hypothetical protein [Rhizobium tropici]
MEMAPSGPADRSLQQSFKIGRLIDSGDLLCMKSDLEAIQKPVAVVNARQTFIIHPHSKGSNHSEKAPHPVPRLRDDEILLGIAALPFRHIIEDDKDVGAVLIPINEAACIDEEGALNNRREVMHHFETDWHALRSKYLEPERWRGRAGRVLPMGLADFRCNPNRHFRAFRS